ncbi:SagB/ThcOx family dehydrogenase [Rhizobium leguminosarum]|uniref:SagB/ThcOx family dehydrogenase n=1 Tax=Rhizobium leguminosarum TaxID=384 RepID=UPI003D6DB205
MVLSWSFDIRHRGPDSDEADLAETFHEATKLQYNVADNPSDKSFDSHDLFLMSRGFRQLSVSEKTNLGNGELPDISLSDVLLKRRSRRDFAGALQLLELDAVLSRALGVTAIAHNEQTETNQVLRAFPSSGGLSCLDTYAVCSRVDGVSSGIYHYNPVASRIEKLPNANAEDAISGAYFNIDYVANAACVIVFVANLDRLSPKYGETRSYRLALLDAGHAAQNVLLCAEALGLNSAPVQAFADDALAKAVGADSVREIVVHSILLGRSTLHVREAGQ